MPWDENTVERVRSTLARRRNVVEKRMIGGLCFVVNGSMCCGVSGKDLVVRVGPHARDRTLAEPHVRPMTFAGRQLAAFVRVAPAGFRTDVALKRWVMRGIDFAATLPTKSKAVARKAGRSRTAH